MKRFCILTLLLGSLLLGCAPRPDPAIESAVVVANHASLRQRNSATSRTVITLDPGDKVEVLEQQANWYRVRKDNIEGWMEGSTVMTDSLSRKIASAATAASGTETQNTATLKLEANLRIEPGRATTIIRKLPQGAKLDVLERSTVPRSDTGQRDVWLKVRSEKDQVGWVLSTLAEFDVPEGLAPYTESYAYSAVKVLQEVEDPELGRVFWYVVGDRSATIDPSLDFDGIRVFTWNGPRHRYETAYRERKLRGMYPLTVGNDGKNTTFRFYVLAADGTRTERNFTMSGVIVRESKKKS